MEGLIVFLVLVAAIAYVGVKPAPADDYWRGNAVEAGDFIHNGKLHIVRPAKAVEE